MRLLLTLTTVAIVPDPLRPSTLQRPALPSTPTADGDLIVLSPEPGILVLQLGIRTTDHWKKKDKGEGMINVWLMYNEFVIMYG